jgi:integrase
MLKTAAVGLRFQFRKHHLEVLGVKLKSINSNPAADVSKPCSSFREMLFMTPSQAKRFLEVARTIPNYPLYATAIGTGLRQGELLALTWSDIDFDKGKVEVKRSLSQVKKEFILKETPCVSRGFSHSDVDWRYNGGTLR